ncbi:MAG: AMP-binding protein [Firmicutes bacterium]|nr:AMP-binding protein [Bacillota bacterium]
MTNLTDFLLTRDFPDDRIQSYYKNQPYTIGEYRTVIPELESKLKELNIPANASALLVLDDSLIAVSFFLACIRYGIIPILASSFTMDGAIDRIIEAADLTLLVSDGSRDLSQFKNRVILAELTGDARPGHAVLSLTNDPADIQHKHIDASELAFFLTTSGSTGLPKIVKHLHSGMIFATRTYGVETLKVTADDRIYSIAKTSFGYGLFNNLTSRRLWSLAA